MSGSVDETNKIFTLDIESGKYLFDKEVHYHSGFVMDVIPTATDDGFLSCGRDSKIFQMDILGTPV